MLAILLSFSLWLGATPVSSFENGMEWITETEYDFGDIAYQKPVQYTFRFKNTSTEPLVIETIRTSCGCTGSTWDETPILADSIGNITIEYDAKKAGYFRKSAKVFFEGKREAERLWVSGYVIGDDE